MADNYLERHREEYEQRKQAWLKKKKHIPKAKQKASDVRQIERPDDEALLKSPPFVPRGGYYTFSPLYGQTPVSARFVVWGFIIFRADTGVCPYA